MKPHASCQSHRAFSLIEVLAIAFAMLLLAVVVLPRLARAKGCSCRISCVNNLKNVGLAFRTFAVDNGGRYPWQLAGTEGGTQEFGDDPAWTWVHFAACSNELSTPKIIACPNDVRRATSNTWASVVFTDLNDATSYFLGFDASEEAPASILGGDRNVSTNGIFTGSMRLMLTSANMPSLKPGFTAAMHGYAGNVLLGDGSVQQCTSGRFQEALWRAVTNSPSPSIRLLIP
jgi:hypothetical protein